MPRPKTKEKDGVPLQIRMPQAVAHEIKIDAVKYCCKYNEFVVRFYGFAKENGLDKWLAEKRRSISGDAPREAFQVEVPLEVAMSIKLDALKNGFKNGEFVELVYTYAKKNGLYGWLKK